MNDWIVHYRWWRVLPCTPITYFTTPSFPHKIITWKYQVSFTMDICCFYLLTIDHFPYSNGILISEELSSSWRHFTLMVTVMDMLPIRPNKTQSWANCWNSYEGHACFPLELLGVLSISLECLAAILLGQISTRKGSHPKENRPSKFRMWSSHSSRWY